MTRYSPEGKRLVQRGLRIRPTPERTAAMDDVAARHGELERENDRLDSDERTLQGQLRAADEKLSQYHGPTLWRSAERRRLQEYRDELSGKLGTVRAGKRRITPELKQALAEASAHRAAVQSLEMGCPECGEAAMPAQVDRVRAWHSYRRGWYGCESCSYAWTART